MRSLIFLLFLLSFLPAVGYAQQQPSRGDLEKRRQVLMESLKETQSQLDATKQDKKATLGQLNALQAKLNAREKLISNINQEISNVNTDIKTSSSEVEQLKSSLKNQQIRYAQSVRYAYSNRSSYNSLAFIFSAADFNDAIRRMKYLKKYRDFRKQQVEEIKITQGQLQSKIVSLGKVKDQKGQLLNTEELQKHELQEERNETKKVVEELKGREGELVAELEKKKTATKRLDNAISAAIKKEIELARKKAEEEERKRKAQEAAKKAAELAAQKAAAQKAAEANNPNVYGSGNQKVILAGGAKYDVPTTPTTETPTAATNETKPKPSTTPTPYNPVANEVKPSASGKSKPSHTPVATPESSELTKDFETSRGKLPWPVANGVVVNQFGKHKHAVATRVEIENNGIDIQTAPGAKARAVFDGVVTSVLVLPGSGSTVIINHGKYFTVYSGLTEVSVKRDDKVSSKQAIGAVLKNEDGLPLLNFQVWKGGDKLNPSSWIMAM